MASSCCVKPSAPYLFRNQQWYPPEDPAVILDNPSFPWLPVSASPVAITGQLTLSICPHKYLVSPEFFEFHAIFFSTSRLKPRMEVYVKFGSSSFLPNLYPPLTILPFVAYGRTDFTVCEKPRSDRMVERLFNDAIRTAHQYKTQRRMRRKRNHK